MYEADEINGYCIEPRIIVGRDSRNMWTILVVAIIGSYQMMCFLAIK